MQTVHMLKRYNGVKCPACGTELVIVAPLVATGACQAIQEVWCGVCDTYSEEEFVLTRLVQRNEAGDESIVYPAEEAT